MINQLDMFPLSNLALHPSFQISQHMIQGKIWIKVDRTSLLVLDIYQLLLQMILIIENIIDFAKIYRRHNT